jgi:bifunctional non-homologous end joining protein LigD
MVLEKYKQKRNFSSTPEPAGDPKLAAERAKAASPDKGLFFCVQKHLASHLHYDFRLEHNGVLLSWAVPKGPSLDPKTKRLAMHVEDHPIEYGTFEGVIPEGYGAGIVMLWDQGTWKPEQDDVEAALKKGDLKFTLDGYKLKGSWVLVRTGGRYGSRSGGDARSWLLIKHKDDWSGEVDITEFAPHSVKGRADARCRRARQISSRAADTGTRLDREENDRRAHFQTSSPRRGRRGEEEDDEEDDKEPRGLKARATVSLTAWNLSDVSQVCVAREHRDPPS